jgi:hypothetical protein
VRNRRVQHFEGVSKPVIGRKLESLMGKRPGAAAAARLPSPEDPPSGPGMRSLFRGYPSSAPPRRARIPRWYLLGADLVLMATALLVMYKSPAPLSGNEKFFGVAAVALGACLALIALCGRDRTDA